MANRYQKMTVEEIEAMQFHGFGEPTWSELTSWMGGAPKYAGSTRGKDYFLIHTCIGTWDESAEEAEEGDWIIRDDGEGCREFYLCKPDIFEQTYEVVDG